MNDLINDDLNDLKSQFESLDLPLFLRSFNSLLIDQYYNFGFFQYQKIQDNYLIFW